jgi:hypothetical protein
VALPDCQKVWRKSFGICEGFLAEVSKGVVLTHGSIIESLVGAHAVIGRRDDRVLQFSDYTFDVSVWVCTLRLVPMVVHE